MDEWQASMVIFLCEGVGVGVALLFRALEIWGVWPMASLNRSWAVK